MLGYCCSEQFKSVIEDSGNIINNNNCEPMYNKMLDSDSKNIFRTSAEIFSAINIGWSLGNTLDCYNYKSWTNDAETAWGNPVTTQEMISAVKDAGFNTVRIPVTWGEHIDHNNIITCEWLNRVKEVVDYAYNLNMFVIINMHHDDYIWLTADKSKYESDRLKFMKIWSQICESFKNYDDRLIFEGMNEPRTIGSKFEWCGGTDDERDIINRFAKDFIGIVRASGGNNSHRTLIVTSYAASAVDEAINNVVLPEAENICISLHYYAPWQFSNGDITKFTENGKIELDKKFAQLNEKFVRKGIQVIIGEFGCVASIDDSVRSDYYEYYISKAKSYGIKCVVWDNGIETGDAAYGIFNRNKLSWNETILSGIIKGAENHI